MCFRLAIQQVTAAVLSLLALSHVTLHVPDRTSFHKVSICCHTISENVPVPAELGKQVCRVLYSSTDVDVAGPTGSGKCALSAATKVGPDPNCLT